MKKEGWILIEKELPTTDCKCYVSVEYKKPGGLGVKEAFYIAEKRMFIDRSTGSNLRVIAKAWMPRHVPKPYNPQTEQLPGQMSIKDIPGVVPKGGR